MELSRKIGFFVASMVICLCAAEHNSSIELKRENFDTEIEGKNVLVIFYSPR